MQNRSSKMRFNLLLRQIGTQIYQDDTSTWPSKHFVTYFRAINLSSATASYSATSSDRVRGFSNSIMQ